MGDHHELSSMDGLKPPAANHGGRRGSASGHSVGDHGSVYSHESKDSVYDHDEKAGEKLKHETEENLGPAVAKRRCRDCFWAVLFILFWVGQLIIGIYASQVGNAESLIYGVDYEGNLCGVKNPTRDLTNYPYLFYFEAVSDANYTLTGITPSSPASVCVQSCPTGNPVYYGLPLFVNYSSAICTYDYPQPTNYEEMSAAIANNNCSMFVFPSQQLLYRCIPLAATVEDALNYTLSTNTTGTPTNVTVAINGTAYIDAVVNVLNARNVAMEIFRDLYNSWPYILASAAVAVVLSFVWLFVIQLFAGLVVWLSIILVLFALAGLTVYLWWQYYLLTTNQALLGGEQVIFTQYGLNSYVYNKTTFLVFASIASAAFVIFFLLLAFLRSRIRLAIALIKASCRALRTMPTVFLMPYIKVFLLLLVTVWSIFTALLLSTSTEKNTLVISEFPQYTYSNQNLMAYLNLYVVFGYFWAWNFVIAMADTTVAGSVATWYWTRDKKKLAFWVVFPSFYRVLRYHVGSLALGSLIIAIVQFIRYMLHRIEKSVKGAKNPIVAAIFKCLMCCFLCAERFLKFLDQYAYVEIAVYGYSFCAAARSAFELITRNVVRVVVVDKISDFILFSSRLIITIVATVVGNYWLLNNINSPTYWAMPLLVMFVLAYAISYLFVVVISMAITTMFICFCEDSERNDGSAEKPYYMEKGLRKLLHRGDKKQSDLAHK